MIYLSLPQLLAYIVRASETNKELEKDLYEPTLKLPSLNQRRKLNEIIPAPKEVELGHIPASSNSADKSVVVCTDLVSLVQPDTYFAMLIDA